MAATKGNMTLRVEPELKAQAAALFKSLGMDLSTATGIFYRQALRYHGLPFEVKLDEPNEVTYEAMAAAENDEEMYGPFDNDGGTECLNRNLQVSLNGTINGQ